MRLDKSYYKKHSFKEASEHQSLYNKMSGTNLSATFLFMMQAAFGFTDSPWPKMDKHFFEKRKR